MPATNSLRVDLTLDLVADGVAALENALVCLGSLTCRDHLEINALRMVVDLDVHLDATGTPQVTIAQTDVRFDDTNVAFELRDCALDAGSCSGARTPVWTSGPRPGRCSRRR